MSKLYVLNTEEVWQTAASLAASGSVTSGSFITKGYTWIVGILATNASGKAASGLSIYQSCDSGSNWDYVTACAPSACSPSAFSIEIIGNAGKIEYRTDSAASQFRTAWYLRPL